MTDATDKPDDEDKALDLARSDLTDEDLDDLEQAINEIDFAARRAAPDRLERLRWLSTRLADVVEQIGQGIRRRSETQRPLSKEEEERYDILVAEGVKLAEKGELDKARQKLEQAARIDPDEPSGLFNLGVLYGKLMDAAAPQFTAHAYDEVYADKAAFCFERTFELDPQNAQALTNLAAIYDIRGWTGLAKEALKKALEIDPKEEKARAHLAELESGGA